MDEHIEAALTQAGYQIVRLQNENKVLLERLRIAIKVALRDELMHPYIESGNTEAFRAIERAMGVVDKVFVAKGG